jgi:hypothetical protein
MVTSEEKKNPHNNNNVVTWTQFVFSKNVNCIIHISTFSVARMPKIAPQKKTKGPRILILIHSKKQKTPKCSHNPIKRIELNSGTLIHCNSATTS